jgi:hypothetical protein
MLLDGSPVVIDFGIAQGPDATRLTLTGMFMGTPGFLAPEVIEGRPSTQASDVHAWGATVAYAATGHPPYGTGPYESIFYRIVNGQAELAAVPRPLLPLLTSALARDPADRPSAAQLAAQVSVLDPASFATPAVMPVAGPGLAGPGLVTRADAAPASQGAPAGHAVPAALGVPEGLGVPGGLGVPEGFVSPAGLGSPHGLGGGLTTAPPASGGPARSAGGGAGLGGGAGAPGPLTRPMGAEPLAPDELARLLPPVHYQPGGAVGQPSAGMAAAASGRPAGVPGPAEPAAVRPRPNRMLVLASMVTAAAASVILPIAGTLISLTLLAALRAAGLAQRRRSQRRLARGSRPSDPFLATVSFPWFLLRAVLAMLLLSPFALAVAALAAGITVVLVPGDWPSRALAYAAGALVLFYGFGPGSHTARNQLTRVYRAAAVTRTAHAVAIVGMTALALAVLAAALSSPSVYWPALAPGRYVHIGIIHLGPHHFRLLPSFGLFRRITLLRHLVLRHLGQLGGLVG